MARRSLIAGLLGVALALGAASPSLAQAATPMDGKGQWVWYVSASGGSGEAIARTADRKGLDVVYVKSGDGRNYWEQFTPELVAALQGRGLDVCAWHYVYGSDPIAEARVSAKAVENGADCLIIDAETEYEGRYSQAHAYVTELRRLVGAGYPLGLSTFPYVDFHPSFPYSVFLGKGGAQYNLPQVYWKAIGTSVRSAVEHTYVFNRPYDREIYPVGQTYLDPPSKDIGLFRRFMNEYKAPGESWWSWQETDGREFRKITKPVKRGVKNYDPVFSYPLLKSGSRGDLVVLAQELLLAHGADGLFVDGDFGRKTREAVSVLQGSAGISQTGQIGDLTWSKLLERDPVSTAWSKRKRGRDLFRAGGPELPRSAGDASRLEFSPVAR